MTLENATERIKARDDYIIVSHDGPDADGLGAAYALALALTSIGKRAVAAVADSLSRKYAFIDRRGLFVPLVDLSKLPFPVERSTLVILDTHDMGYLGSRVSELLGASVSKIILDHHELSFEAGPDEFIDPSASSSCELVYLISRALGATLPLDALEALFSGIVYDTGSFSYPKTGERTFSCALELVRSGVHPYEIHRRMYESSSSAALILQKAVLSTLEIFADGRVAIQSMDRGVLRRSGAGYEDAEDLVNIPLQDRQVEVSLLFKENAEGRLRCSLRSKGKVDVARLAQSFGGGGHRTAAGFSCPSPLESIKADVLETLCAELGRSGCVDTPPIS